MSYDKSSVKRQKKESDVDDYIYVSSVEEGLHKVSRECIRCGNKEVLHWSSEISGEHAGVRQEGTIEHFRCTKCSYSWTERY